jgi:hypothetical protein
VLVRQPAVDLGQEFRPVAQQVEGDQGRDREQEGEIDHRQAVADKAARDRAEQLGGPLGCGRGEVGHARRPGCCQQAVQQGESLSYAV